MKKVWKCDFCSHTSEDFENTQKHESNCTFNHKVKSCYTCKFCIEDGAPISGFYNTCFKKLSCDEGEEGNCDEWAIDDSISIENMKKKIKIF